MNTPCTSRQVCRDAVVIANDPPRQPAYQVALYIVGFIAVLVIWMAA